MQNIKDNFPDYGKKLLELYNIDTGKVSETLVKTDLGLISKDNANWLYSKEVVNKKGRIYAVKSGNNSTELVPLYSYLRWIIDDIKERIPTIPDQVYLNFDDYLQLARTGSLKKPYLVEGMEYEYNATYPVVYDIKSVGKDSFVRHQPESKKKAWNLDLI